MLEMFLYLKNCQWCACI